MAVSWIFLLTTRYDLLQELTSESFLYLSLNSLLLPKGQWDLFSGCLGDNNKDNTASTKQFYIISYLSL